MSDFKLIKEQIVEEVGGPLPDGSGFATASFPLPKDHWLYAEPEKRGTVRYDAPPMPLRMSSGDYLITAISGAHTTAHTSMPLTKEQAAEMIRMVGKWAYRASSNNGKIDDIDPDALIQNLVVGFLGYWTDDGLTDDAWANPKEQQREKK